MTECTCDEASLNYCDVCSAQGVGRAVAPVRSDDCDLSSPDDPRYVYVIGGEGSPLKIGFSMFPDGRRSELQCGNPVALSVLFTLRLSLTEARRVERATHVLLRERRIKNEWFAVDLVTAAQAITLSAS